MKNPETKTKLCAVAKVAIRGGLLFAAFTFFVIICFHLFAHGSGEGGVAMFFALIRGVIGLPVYLIIGNKMPTAPFNGIFTDDLICILMNTVLGTIISAIVAAILFSIKRSNDEK
ncbi:MAG: hypothetical protein PHY43_09235 [Verrucomicrobiales bacterium]|nr:hypothetical protein [Verrucomicrobiales bacterium]